MACLTQLTCRQLADIGFCGMSDAADIECIRSNTVFFSSIQCQLCQTSHKNRCLLDVCMSAVSDMPQKPMSASRLQLPPSDVFEFHAAALSLRARAACVKHMTKASRSDNDFHGTPHAFVQCGIGGGWPERLRFTVVNPRGNLTTPGKHSEKTGPYPPEQS